ncbi:MAG: pyridoxamine 5'-phosphate oxidase [Verrucomicrobiota bacterium]
MASENPQSIADLRENYDKGTLGREDLHHDPIQQFEQWFDDARQSGMPEPNAMTLATVARDGGPRSRTVLLKGLSEGGFVFYTNYQSQKGQDLAEAPRAALSFLWKELERQVQVRGIVEKVSREESLEYFQSRPYSSRIGAWASDQSQRIPDREWLVQKNQETQNLYPETDAIDCVPLPDFWGGYRVIPETIEFWQGQPGRLHDRFMYSREGSRWVIHRLSP